MSFKNNRGRNGGFRRGGEGGGGGRDGGGGKFNRSFTGGGNNGGGNFNRSGGGNFNKGGRGGGGRGNFDQGPPERVIPLAHFSYVCQNDLVCKVDIDDVPYFNAPIFLENKEQIGKIDEIFGTLRDYYVSVKLSENVYANSFKPSQKLFIDPSKLLPIARFLPKTPQPKSSKKKGAIGGFNKGPSRGGGRGGFGGGFSQGGKGGRGSFSKSGFNQSRSRGGGSGGRGWGRR